MSTIKNENPVFDLVNGVKCIVLDDKHFGDLGTQYPYFYNGKIFRVVGTSKKGTSAKKYHYTIDGDETLYKRDITNMKKHLGCDHVDHYTPREENATANDSEKASNTKRSKRSANETAEQIRTKYADTIKNVREKVSKLQADDRILGALNLLCTMIEQTAAERIENITNAEKAKRTARLERISYLSSTMPQLQLQAVEAMQNGDFERALNLGKDAKEMQAELILLQAEEAAYNASLASEESEETETTETETTAEETASEQPAE